MIHYWWIQEKWQIVDPSGPLNYMSTQIFIEFLDRTKKSTASRQKKFPSRQKKFP